METNFEKNGLRYELVGSTGNSQGYVGVYKVTLLAAENSGWKGNIGYRAIGCLQLNPYRNWATQSRIRADQEVEVVVNGPGLSKARKKIYDAQRNL